MPKFLKNKVNRALLFILMLFALIRLPGIDVPYYQDEWKNVNASESMESAGNFFAHPPLMQVMFVIAHNIFGMDWFRVFPLIIGLASAVLLYLVVRRRYGERPAIISLVLFSISFYNILGSLVPDVDGAILPLFFLLALYSYDHFNDGNSLYKKRWFVVFCALCLIGLLIKLSFIIVIGAFILDYAWNRRRDINTRGILWIGGLISTFVVLYTGILLVVEYAYPAFRIDAMLGHAESYSAEAAISYMQIIVQSMKAIYYLSPILLVPLLFITRDTLKRTSIFFAYILVGLAFYLVLFDFSRGALDKYLIFLVAPLSAICGLILSRLLDQGVDRKVIVKSLCVGFAVSVVLVLLNFLPHAVLALHPKTEWFSRVLHGSWNVLTPMTGGSGPLGFYVSFLFIAASFLASLVATVIALLKREWRTYSLAIIFAIAISYNAVFAEEYMYGKINGSTSDVLAKLVSSVRTSDSITQVITYNDIGAHQLSVMNKYAGRFYANPDFEEGHRIRFANFQGHYMVIDIPHLYENGFYGEFFKGCKVILEESSRAIKGRVYDCNS